MRYVRVAGQMKPIQHDIEKHLSVMIEVNFNSSTVIKDDWGVMRRHFGRRRVNKAGSDRAELFDAERNRHFAAEQNYKRIKITTIPLQMMT